MAVKKKPPTTVIRVPVALVSDIKELIIQHNTRIGNVKAKGHIVKERNQFTHS